MIRFKQVNLLLMVAISILLLSFQSALAVQVSISDVPGYGYNSGVSPFAGCGPTSGTMILDTYDNRLTGTDGSPGDLVSDPYTTTWDLHYNYMNTNDAGFGPPSDMHHGIEEYAFDQGYSIDAFVHVEPTTYNPAGWIPPYDSDEVVPDADFWDTTTWDIKVDEFLDFIKIEVDAGRPFMATVDSGGSIGDDHWMVGVGYDYDTKEWAGYNTWDTSLHWYTVQSAYVENYMGIGFIRTFAFNGAIENGGPGQEPVPEPATMLLFGTGLAGLAGYRKRRGMKK